MHFRLLIWLPKKQVLVQELKKEGTPEAVNRVENIEELLNGIRDFVEGQREIVDAKGSLVEFLEDVALRLILTMNQQMKMLYRL